jgi:hypothetical protein
VARIIVARFPELKVNLTQDRAWKERYHQNMFDAVALGMMVLNIFFPKTYFIQSTASLEMFKPTKA